MSTDRAFNKLSNLKIDPYSCSMKNKREKGSFNMGIEEF